MRRLVLIALAPVALLLLGMEAVNRPPLPTVDRVDLPRFMGNWYLIAAIPTSYEQGAHNAVESYSLEPDGTVATTFTYRKDGFDGPLKTMRARGFIRDSSNAVWGMRVFWPIKAEYLIAYLSPDYSQTIVARTKRDHVWIMARTPEITAADYAARVEKVRELGYDVDKLERVPQRW